MTTVFTENPETDLWKELLQFTYEANIKRYLDKKGHDVSEDTINTIAGSFLQAHEYYKAAKNADLQISPLLLYYGSTNLLYGMSSLLTGNINKVNHHGMKILSTEKIEFIADTKIKFINPQYGGVHVFSRALGLKQDLTQFDDWNLREFLDSIAEISSDYIQCYEVKMGCIAMLDIFNTPDGKVEKLYFTDDNKSKLLELLKRVDGFEKSYLRVTSARDYKTGQEYFVLRQRMIGENIQEQSYSGQPYLRAGHIKNGNLITVPTILNMYISLFALGSLCRYYPELWSPFVIKDSTGEKLLFEKFMYYARRLIPNYVLNILMEDTIQYSSNQYMTKDKVKLVGEHQIQEIVEQKVKNELNKQSILIKGKK